jgi:hypothetical protein
MSRHSLRITHRVFALAALPPILVGAAVAWTSSPVHTTSKPSAYDYCVIVYPVYVDDRQVFAGGRYCVPVPGPQPASQPM